MPQVTLRDAASPSMNSPVQVEGLVSQARYLGFDLDGTLHDYPRAARCAMAQVYSRILSVYSHLTEEEMAAAYSEILKGRTPEDFTDGRTSYQYREERFSVLLHACLPGVSPAPDFIRSLLETYEETFLNSLAPEPGMRDVLIAGHSAGKKIFVITEGPQDAQERVVQALNIEPYVDVLATSNAYGISKIDGLVSKVIERHSIPSSEFIYIGDNYERDIEPLKSHGISSIHYAPLHSPQSNKDCLSIVSWSQLLTAPFYSQPSQTKS